MTEISVNINPEDIEEAIVKSVIASSLGSTLKEIIEKELTGLTSTYQKSSLRMAIEAEIQRIIMVTITQEYAEKIKEASREMLTDKMVQEMTSAALSAWLDKME